MKYLNIFLVVLGTTVVGYTLSNTYGKLAAPAGPLPEITRLPASDLQPMALPSIPAMERSPASRRAFPWAEKTPSRASAVDDGRRQAQPSLTPPGTQSPGTSGMTGSRTGPSVVTAGSAQQPLIPSARRPAQSRTRNRRPGLRPQARRPGNTTRQSQPNRRLAPPGSAQDSKRGTGTDSAPLPPVRGSMR